MIDGFRLVAPRIQPPLDPGFRPPVLAHRAFEAAAREAGAVPLVFGLERTDGTLSRFETVAFPEGHPRAAANLGHAERLFKFLLWQRGGYRAFVGGPPSVAAHLRDAYAPGGARAFDAGFMGKDVYGRAFEVLGCDPEAVPQARESGKPLGRHLDGCRIGFDLGGSDRKVSAVLDGKAVFSEEVVWEPKTQADPGYHERELVAGLERAASHLPRVDAIGGSAAGIYVDNEVRIASLFRGIPEARYPEVRGLFHRIRARFGVPLEVANDGDVTALAGSMSLEDNGILGLALGTSQAAGYVDLQGRILGWLNELAFAPVDLGPEGAVDEWSGDRGVGSMYFSQQGVFRLARRAGLEVPEGLPDAERLKAVQAHLEAGHPGGAEIWKSIGVWLGYALAHYAAFYELRHVLILGRCTSGRGGELILAGARVVLRQEFPELSFAIQLPDERSRRVGQSIAAASLPALP
ncbi:MAG: ROK family protein [Acidobacteria bacterium]|nr:ROK family protein [Acidobacteriota bacterium]